MGNDVNIIKTTVFLLFTFITSSSVIASEVSLSIKEGTIRTPIPGMKNTVAYMTLINSGDETIILTKASSNAAPRVEFHDHLMEGGSMKMVKLEQLILTANSRLQLQSGGVHLMFFNADKKIITEQAVTIELTDTKGRIYSAELRPETVYIKHHHE